MTRSLAAKVVGIYSILLGMIVALYYLIAMSQVEEDSAVPAATLLFPILFIILGSLTLSSNKTSSPHQRKYIITLLVFYLMLAATGLIFLAFPAVGELLFWSSILVSGTPIFFTFWYFSLSKKEDTSNHIDE
ncbi:MAG: hypothetical protein WC225_05410 [Acholeplasmataceae bacterium]|nr:hypothetical protein [Acholeplasmataceae bacterium]